MELLTDVLAIVGAVLLANSAFAFFVRDPSETPKGEYLRKVKAFGCSTIALGLIAASVVLGN